LSDGAVLDGGAEVEDGAAEVVGDVTRKCAVLDGATTPNGAAVTKRTAGVVVREGAVFDGQRCATNGTAKEGG